MKIYKVGGVVRDRLLGLAVTDCDYLVVGTTPAQMLAQGFKAVGKDFPVFLHPQTHEEYALARTERKQAPGHAGFYTYAAEDVSLEQDLARRDLTINAIAEDEHGQLVDPYGGVADLHAGILRHVSPAFVEDPLRVLRTARFAARFGFEVAAETRALMATMVASGELKHLAAERIWQELSKGLMTDHPSLMLAVLVDCQALQQLLPELSPDVQRVSGAVLDNVSALRWPLASRWALLLSRGLSKQAHTPVKQQLMAIHQRLKCPNDCRQLAQLSVDHQAWLQHPKTLSADNLLTLLLRCDALRRPQRFTQCVEVACAEQAALKADWLALLAALQAVDIPKRLIQHHDRISVAALVYQHRLQALIRYLAQHPFR